MPSIFTRKRIAYYSTALLVCALIIQVVSVIRDREIGGDFAAFYAEGKVALKYPHADLYNIDLQDREYSSLMGAQMSSPVAFMPWFTIILSLFARLPYLMALAVWTVISATFLVLGFLVTARSIGLPGHWNRLGTLACLAFPPYVFYTLINGQPSAFSFFVIALTYFLVKSKRHLFAGLTLSLLTFKPTLLVFIGPMILLTRQWKVFLGLLIGGAALVGISLLWAGVQGARGYFNLLNMYTQAINAPHEIFQTYKYVDIGAAVRLLLGSQFRLRLLLLAIVVPLVFYLWYRVGPRPVSWSLAIVCGILFNLYSPIYDCTPLIFAVLVIGIDTLKTWLIVALYLVPLITVPFAKFSGVQLYTLVLIALFIALVWRAAGHLPSSGPVGIGNDTN
jgi:alpha-1,2-mannosyltransferase